MIKSSLNYLATIIIVNLNYFNKCVFEKQEQSLQVRKIIITCFLQKKTYPCNRNITTLEVLQYTLLSQILGDGLFATLTILVSARIPKVLPELVYVLLSLQHALPLQVIRKSYNLKKGYSLVTVWRSLQTMTKFYEICYDMTVLTIYVIVHGVCLHTNAPALINCFFNQSHIQC